jgi:nicotinamidase-related amidase
VQAAAKIKEGIVTNTAFLGFGYTFDIVHADGNVARSAKSTAERGAAKQAARPKDWLTVLIKLRFTRGYVDQPKRSPVFDRAQELGAVELDAPATAFNPDLDDSQTDLVITKPRVAGLYDTRLGETLRARRVERLTIVGVSSSLTAQSTAREAHDRDFEVYILEDTCATVDRAEHESSMAMLKAVAKVIHLQDLGKL